MIKEPQELLLFSPDGDEIVGMVHLGGYYRWSFQFPFRHWVEEDVLIATRGKVYKWQPPKAEE